MRYKHINNLLGWLVFLLALGTYLLTLEPTASFWDCGEFTASAHHLLVPHPPGAPTFLLLGRLASLLSFGHVTYIPILINGVSALASAFTVLFLFWIITMLGRKLLQLQVIDNQGFVKDPDFGQTALIQAAGAVGALAFTFSDSFWFNAVEAEVYAMSTLFTAFVVWAMLKWDRRADEADSDKWLILIAYAVGLSIGVHLLNLLAIPALGFVYYFRRAKKPSTRGGLLTLGLSCAVVLAILVGVIPGLPTLAGAFEVYVVNNFGLPFNSGLLCFLVLFVGLIGWGFRYSFRRGSHVLNTAMLCFVFVLIGYSSYLIVPIRSSYNPTIDENKPGDVLSFVSYLKREQYGNRPLLYGPHLFAQPIDQQEGAPHYIRQGNRYVVSDHRQELVYPEQDNMLLPRIYGGPAGATPDLVREYQKWVGIQEGGKPTMAQNLGFLLNYQILHMYGRYFLWNFVGRESDVQQASALWPTATQHGLPQSLADNKARNNFFALPLLLGLAGLFFQIRYDKRNALVVSMLFVLTGLAIVFYLNQPPVEPRERDYTFAGSTFAFAIWIGLGVIGLAEMLRAVVKAERVRVALVTMLGLVVPTVMATQGWDDHDRSGRYASVDWAKNMLNSVAPNAILITEADNDTFPLWYAQEVEGVRRDVRVAVVSYLNTDWYLNQMKRRSYASQPLPLSIKSAQYQQGTNDYLPYVPNAEVKEVNLKEFIQLVDQNSPLLQVSYGDGGPAMLSFPTTKFYLPVDTAAVQRLGIVPAERRAHLASRMQWDVGKGALEKKSLAILDLLATNNWQRPVYFSSSLHQEEYRGLEPYLQMEGLAYRVLPCRTPEPKSQAAIEVGYVAKDITYDSLMRKFTYRNLNNPHVYYDETQRRTLAEYRDKFARLATAYLASGEKAKAKEVLDKCLTVMPDAALPYDYYSANLVAPLVQVGEQARAAEIMDTLTSRTEQNLAYYRTHDAAIFEREVTANLITLRNLYQAAADTGNQAQVARLGQLAEQYFPRQ
ncbi:glycosyltransferase family 117 protein [Hymenobacter jejuensis]|uniref:DUF2723 domain-containing protein n=1 Tax=Hymenobacter jejuensis TaxID=2502781 RepID=A0A5B7ZX82_9BACT|nr:DUF2723 domain-containing protein [Hymenobacter jejuensis]QDA59116.1 DUF2723 domain-containing protein [Hymenobacter jejuensis]